MIEKAMNAKSSDIEAAYSLKGGWEGWAQVELALYLQKVLSGSTIEREMAVYAGNTQLADLVITGETINPENTAIIELKCRNSGHANFARTVKDDLKKIKGKIVERYEKVPIRVVAISIEDQTEEKIFEQYHMQKVELDAKVNGQKMRLWYTGVPLFDTPGAPKKQPPSSDHISANQQTPSGKAKTPTRNT